MTARTRHSLFAATLVSVTAVATACGDDAATGSEDGTHAGAGGAHSDTECMEYSQGMQHVGANGWTVSIDDAVPAPPALGDNAWDVTVLDASGGAPDEEVTLLVTPEMPAHGHGSAAPTVSKLGSGKWDVDAINLRMPGQWTVTFAMLDPVTPDPDKPLDSVTFSFCVDTE